MRRLAVLAVVAIGCAATAAERGRAAASRGDYVAAARAYREALRDEPQSAGLWSALGQALYADEKYADARTAFEKAADLAPHDPIARIRIGNTWEIERDWDAALAAYRDATKAAPHDARAWRTLGQRLARWEKLDEAREALRTAAEIDPSAPEVHHNLALVAAAQGDLETAEASFRRAIRARSGYRPAQLGLAGLLVNAGRHEEALRLYREIAEADPPIAAAWIAIALLEETLHHPERARPALERAVDLARAAWERTGRRSPAHAATLARALAMQGERGEARAVVTEARRSAPEDESLEALATELDGGS